MRLLLVFLLFLIPPGAQAEMCPSSGNPPVVNLTVEQTPPRNVNTHTILQLREKMKGQGSAVTAGSRHVPLGLTQSQLRHQSRLTASVVRLPSGAWCASIQALDVRISFADTQVFVATDLARDSCIYQEVLAHEYRHVAVDRQLANDWRERLRVQISAAAYSTGMVRAASSQLALQSLEELLAPLLNRAMEEMVAERNRRQAQVDTPEEYRRVSRACNGEVRRYIPDSLRP